MSAVPARSSELDPSDEEELLLIIAGMGLPQPAEEDGTVPYWRGEETSDCVSDLQRYLRRDDPYSMATHRALGMWRTMQLHLIPLLRTCTEEASLVFNVLKLVVKLTMKPEQLGAKIAEHLKDKKVPDPQMGKYMTELQGYHKEYKKAFLTGDAMGAIVRLLGSCLNEPDHSRSDEQTMIIELILALLLNLLHTSHPDAPNAEAGRESERAEDNALLRNLGARHSTALCRPFPPSSVIILILQPICHLLRFLPHPPLISSLCSSCDTTGCTSNRLDATIP